MLADSLVIYILISGPLRITDDTIQYYLNQSVVKGDGNEGSTAVRRCREWSIGRGDAVHRPFDPISATLDLKKREILRLCHFALWLCLAFGIRTATARGYVSTVNAWHKRRNMVGLAADADPYFIVQCLKGLSRTHVPIRPTYVRIGISAHHLASGMDKHLGKRGQCSAKNQNMRALLAVCFAGLFRGCEPCFQDGKPTAFQFLPKRKHIVQLGKGSKGVVIREAKRTSLTDITPFKSTTIQFYDGGEFVDAVAELIALQLVDPAKPDDPLFRCCGNRHIKVSELRDAVKAVAKAAGLDPAFFGAHSLRYCTALPLPASSQ